MNEACTTIGCPNPATVRGDYRESTVTYHGITYCAGCAELVGDVFTPDGAGVTHDEIAELVFRAILACREEGITDPLRTAHAIAVAIKLAEEDR